jgi:myosin heavy subunit
METTTLSLEKFSKIWIPHPQDLWILGEVISISDQDGTAEVTYGDDQRVTINLDETLPYHPTHGDNLDDLCGMNNFHEAPLLHSLRVRLLHKSIYTSIGDVLVSVNPYELIGDLYNEPLRYLTTKIDVTTVTDNCLPPHVFRIANDALSAMLRNSGLISDRDQSIIISGESGAGDFFLEQANLLLIGT